MLCKDIMKVIETIYPKHAALEWDNVGLLVGRTEKDVKTIYVALDATDEVIEDAISSEVDMLITHHPLLFSPMKQITDEEFLGKRIVKLLQHDISYYAMHTNYDVLAMAQYSAERLELKDMEVLELTNQEENQGIGRVGSLQKEISVSELCSLVKKRFLLDNVKVYGALDKKIKRVAISPGSGKHMSKLAIDKGADVFVTGDIDYHEGMDAIAQGLVIVDAGHYGLEHIFVEEMICFLKEKLLGIWVIGAEKANPFHVI